MRLFPTLIYNRPLGGKISKQRFNRELMRQCQLIEKEDAQGQKWSLQNYRNGFTSYGTLGELHRAFPHFAELEELINPHVKKFAKALHWDLQHGKLKMVSCWVNIMRKNTIHSLHLHPLSVVSGTYYVSCPPQASAIKFEDPRLSKMMSCPPKKPSAPKEFQPFVSVDPKAGNLILFESWLRHEVPLSKANAPRISVSFNYDWV